MPAKVIGVGMTHFKKPSQSPSYIEMGAEAARSALTDAGVDYRQIQHAYVGYIFGDTTCGQRTLYEMGMTGVPIFNVNNACATGSSALFLARQAVESGVVDCALALGFEQMIPGALGTVYKDRCAPVDKHLDLMHDVQGDSDAPMTAQMFGGAAREYIDKYGAKKETFAKISVKARKHAAGNPRAVFRDPLTLDEVMNSPEIFDPLTRFQCCPPTCGGAAAVVCSEEFARKHGSNGAVSIKGQAFVTDTPSTFDDKSIMKMVGYDMTANAAKQLYEQTGIGPEDVDVVELHDCFSANELITYEALGLTPEGTAEKFIEDGDNTYGGKFVVNPSGGLLSKGHPIGATGLAQCAEMVWQMRGEADARQVDGAKIALQHNIGIPGACVVTMYERG